MHLGVCGVITGNSRQHQTPADVWALTVTTPVPQPYSMFLIVNVNAFFLWPVASSLGTYQMPVLCQAQHKSLQGRHPTCQHRASDAEPSKQQVWVLSCQSQRALILF